MALVVPAVGEQYALGLFVGKESPSDLVLRLYVNDVTPGNGDTAATYTEAAGAGYAAKTLAGASWTVSGGGPATATYAAQTWTFSGPLGNVYGYYVTRSTGGELAYAERFSDGPYAVTTAGDVITVTPVFTGS